ncbi:hypothetical protein DPX16_20018 [Anabarilius grahami]|uniref:Uncharacterized protein n=1 Tax=Anabarilius grahami TaxID=495550 RepID=A0A3N0Z4S1_ANAGA|nr:hypothetical protein DPX16_20018 [Anabarilius grahami]
MPVESAFAAEHGGVMEWCRLRSEQDISRCLHVDGGRNSRREEEKENEIGELVVLTARDFTKIPKAVAENLKTDLDNWWAACGGTEGLCMVGSVGGLWDSP